MRGEMIKLLKRVLAHARLVYKRRWLGWNLVAQQWFVYSGETEKMVECYRGVDFHEALRQLFIDDDYLIGG